MLVKFILLSTIFGVFPMLPGVYMVKFDMLNPNLTSKITKNLNQSQKQQIKTCCFQMFGTDVRNGNRFISPFGAPFGTDWYAETLASG